MLFLVIISVKSYAVKSYGDKTKEVVFETLGIMSVLDNDNFENSAGASEIQSSEPNNLFSENNFSELSGASTEAQLIYTADFENGNLGDLRSSGNSPVVTTYPVRSGKYAMKTYLHCTRSSNNYRTEAYVDDHASIGEDYWYGFSVYLPHNYIPDRTWEIIAQWHGVPDGYPNFYPGTESWRNPILSLRTTDGKWSLLNYWDSKAYTGSVYGGSKLWEIGNYETGKWVDFVFHMKWSYWGDGILEVWKDGELVISRVGPNCFNDKVGPYLKMGMYKGWENWWNYPSSNWWNHDVVDDRTLYHDELRIARGKNGYNVVSLAKQEKAKVYATEYITICDGENYLGWTKDGKYERTLKTDSGADSIVTTYLTVNPIVYTSENITINVGEEYRGWTESGKYERTLTSSAGCDSIVTTYLSVTSDAPLDSEEFITICEGENYLGWDETGEYQRTIQVTNEESSLGPNLIVNGSFTDGTKGWETWTAGGYDIEIAADNQNFVTSPSAMKIVCKSNGSTVTNIHFICGNNIKIEAGKEYQVTFNAKATTAFNLGNILVIKRTTPFTEYGSFSEKNPAITTQWKQVKLKFTATASASDGSFRIYLGKNMPVGESLYLDDFSFTETSESPVQSTKESIVTTYLTVNPLVYTTENITINEGETYFGWTESGKYERTLTSSTGCDSIVTTNLNIISSTEETSQEYITICEGEDYLGWTESGEYSRTIQVTNPETSVGPNLIENGSFDNGINGWKGWTASGYDFKLSADNKEYFNSPSSLRIDCISNNNTVYYMQLILDNNIKVEAGKEYQLTFYAKATTPFNIGNTLIIKNSSPFSKYGNFSERGPAISTEWKQVSLKFTATTTASDGSFRIYLGNNMPVGETLYLDDFSLKEQSESSVESTKDIIITTYLTVNPTIYTTEFVNIAPGENYLGWTEPGEYDRVLSAVTGCDSIVTTVLNVTNDIQSETAQSSVNELKSANDNEYNIPDLNIENNSSQIFISKPESIEFLLFPNPASSFINIHYSSKPNSETRFEIININGQVVHNQIVTSDKYRINVANYTPGLYYIKSTNHSSTNVKKLIIQ